MDLFNDKYHPLKLLAGYCLFGYPFKKTLHLL